MRWRIARGFKFCIDAKNSLSLQIFGQGKKRNAKGHKKNRNKSKSTNYKKSKKGGAGTGNDLTDKIVAALEKHKEVNVDVFFLSLFYIFSNLMVYRCSSS